jgi:hypothetical protein
VVEHEEVWRRQRDSFPFSDDFSTLVISLFIITVSVMAIFLPTAVFTHETGFWYH